MKTYNGIERLARNYTTATDDYEYSMSDCYLAYKKNEEDAVFDIFFRKIPNGGGYAIMAGLDKVIPFIQNLKFTEKDLDGFREDGYEEEIIDYLRNFKFTGDIYAIPDGTPIFPNEPILTVKAPLIETQVVETVLLSIVNGAISHSTAAKRIVEATPKNVGVMEFGSRRGDGEEAGIDAAIYAIMSGCIGTSNRLAAKMLNLKPMGTIAHSFLESFDTELEGFIAYAKKKPNNCILLVDTIDTLRSGVPNAIKTFNYMKENGISTDHIGIRIDSGDLAYLSKEAKRMLTEAGFPQAKICLSNGLKAETIESLIQQGAVFNSLGVGDNISKPEGNVGCVYKEVAITKNNELIPKIKISNDTIKTINPDFKKLYRVYDKDTGYAVCDVMARRNEEINKRELEVVNIIDNYKTTTLKNFDLVELQQTIFKNGELVYYDPEIMEKQKYCNDQMQTLYPEVRRTLNPHEYYVDGTKEYVDFKNDMINKVKKLVR